MIELHQGPRAWNTANLSPFCIKVELYLRLCELPYKVRSWNPQAAPKGKMPFIVIDDGQKIGDSELILDHLKSTYPNDLDAHLSPQDHAVGRALCRMLEEGTYFLAVQYRWFDPVAWPQVRDKIFGSLPALPRMLVPALVRRRVRQAIHMQGASRHTAQEKASMGCRDIDAVAAVLADKEYLLGDTISSYDCCIYAMLSAVLDVPFSNPLQTQAQSHKNLVDYCQRVGSKYFSDVLPQFADQQPTAAAA